MPICSKRNKTIAYDWLHKKGAKQYSFTKVQVYFDQEHKNPSFRNKWSWFAHSCTACIVQYLQINFQAVANARQDTATQECRIIWSWPSQLEMLPKSSSSSLWQWALLWSPMNCWNRWNMPRSRTDWPRSWSHPSTRWWSKASIRIAGPKRRRTGGCGCTTSGTQSHSCKQQAKHVVT